MTLSLARLHPLLVAIVLTSSSSDIALAQSPGMLDSTFATGSGVEGEVRQVLLQPDGSSLLFGGFGVLNGVTVGRAVRLGPDGTRDPSFATAITGVIRTAALQPDGQIIVGGSFASPGGENLARLRVDGSFDPGFAVGVGTNGTVWTVAIDASGRVVAGGAFNVFAGAPRNFLVRLQPDGSVDPSFAVGSSTNLGVRKIVIQPDGKLLLGGDFTTFQGVTHRHLVRLLDDGQLDPSFSTGSGFTSVVKDIALQPDGKILVVGTFSGYDGVARPALVRLLPDGTLDPAFVGVGSTGTRLDSVALLPSGRILLGGLGSISGGTCAGVALLTPAGLPVSDFFVGSGMLPPVHSIVPVSEHLALVGGKFSAFNGTICGGILRVWTSYACFEDVDGDGFGSSQLQPSATPCGVGYSTVSGDCDDTSAAIHPGVLERCDGIDNDCNGFVDENVVSLFCTAGTTVAGCVPRMAFTGFPSVSSAGGFELVVSNVPARRSGMIFYSFADIPNGEVLGINSTSVLCIQAPRARTIALDSGGATGTCLGELRLDFNQFMATTPNAPGAPFQTHQVLYAQAWIRDPGAEQNVNLSDAIRFALCD